MSGPIKQSPRFIAAQALDEVIHNEGFSGAVLDQQLSGHALSPEDKGFCTELFYGTLRWKTALERSLHQACTKPNSKFHKKILPHLLVAAYQLHHLKERIPPYATINEALRCIKKAKAPLTGFANAILRNLPQPAHLHLAHDANLDHFANAYSFSPSVLAATLAGAPQNQWAQACEALNQRPSLTVRAQGTPEDIKAWLAQLEQKQVRVEPHPWCPQAFVLYRTGNIQNLPGFSEGRFWVQDAASQLCALLCSVQPGTVVYDLCAAPGGKSLILQSQLGKKDRVTSVEISPAKEKRMRENAERMKLPFQPRITDALDFAADPQFHEKAHVVLLDAPCSATGTFRRHPEIKWQKSTQNADEAKSLQSRLLTAAARLVRPGGQLVYSVCSLFLQEGPEVVHQFLTQNPNFNIQNAHPNAPYLPDNAVTSEGLVALRPHLHDSDGFFMAVLKKQ